MRAETAGWTGGEDEETQVTKHGTQLNLDLGLNEEDGAEWVLWQSLQSQISIAGLGQR